MLKISAVSYLNTKPFLYGLFKSGLDKELQLTLDTPNECARQLLDGSADLALLPVGALPDFDEYHLIGDYCIGATGPVRTVCIFADQPLESLTHLYLDFHSRTSVELTRILLSEYWRLHPVLLPATPGFEREIAGTTGALVIGDRAIPLLNRHPYSYDLGEAWIRFTGMPFVFAAWVSRRPLDTVFVERFNNALLLGIQHIPQLIYILPTPQPGFDLQRYFTENISYPLDDAKREGLHRFLKYLHAQQAAPVRTQK